MFFNSRNFRALFCFGVVFFGITFIGHAAVLVKDTWTDGSRAQPTQPTYSEFGTDPDGDGDFESAWYDGGVQMSASSNHMNTVFTNGGYATTYFAPSSAPVTLTKPGDQIKVTWRFAAGFVLCWSTELPLAIGLINTPNGSRLTGDGAPGSASYSGYAAFFGGSSGVFSRMSVRRRAPSFGPMFDPTSPGLNGWTESGYDPGGGGGSGGMFTLLMSATRNTTGGLVVSTTVAKDGVGLVRSNSFTDASPATFSFNTFVIRDIPAFFGPGGWGVGVTFDSALFQVEATNIFPPRIRSIEPLNGAMNLTWDSVSGHVYRVQYATDVLASAWFNLGANISATNSLTTASDPAGSVPIRFYRVALLP